MNTLKDYLLENLMIFEQKISDNEILYTIGLNWINGAAAAKETWEEYGMNKNNYREKIIQLAKDKFYPLIDAKDEVIPRSQWTELKDYIGQTEGQLMSRHYYDVANIMNKEPRKHDVLTLFQCSAKKPYHDNRPYGKGYMKWAKEWSDAASISDSGIIFWDYSDKYPYRYEDWNVGEQAKLPEEVDIDYKVLMVSICRFIKMMRMRQYKHVLVVMPNQDEQKILDEVKNHDIDGLADKVTIVITQRLRDKLDKAYPKLKNLMPLRMQSMGAPREAYIRCLRKVVKPDDKEHFEKVTQEQLDNCKQVLEKYAGEEFSDRDVLEQIHESYVLTESRKQPEYKVMNFPAQEVIKKFKDNIKDFAIDKDSNELYYKSYYWTALDILLMVMDGNVTEDIDDTYWKLRAALDKDNDFQRFGDFCYIYKPLMDDKVSVKELEEEAYKIHLLRPEPDMIPKFIK